MSGAPTIPARVELPPPQDYAFLRSEGLKHIQALSSQLWTDHNAHDPGVTILELLCYALTDLTYRTAFDTRDLLARKDGGVDPPELSGLFPAHEVLTCAPLTIGDFRRLLLRIRGVRNAWLDPMSGPAAAAGRCPSEVPIYADCGADELSFDATSADGRDNHPVPIRGLYKVLVELEIDDELGSLNTPDLELTVTQGPLKGVVLAIAATDPAFLAGEVDFGPGFVEVAGVDSVTAGAPGEFEADLRIVVDGGAEVALSGLAVTVLEDRPRPTAEPVAVGVAALQQLLEVDSEQGPMALFWRKQQARAAALAKVSCALHAHRSLCEDFLCVETVTPFQVGVCADIEVAPDADLEEVQARVFHEIEKYFSPPVRYRTLAEMLAEGHAPDEIWSAPYVDFDLQCDGEAIFSKPGFLTEEELERTGLRSSVHVSDIINLVVDVPGVVAIRGVMLRPYGADGKPLGPSERWTLAVPADHQPVFDFEHSKLLFFKGELPYRAQPSEFQRTLEHLRAMDETALYVEPDQTLQLPLGRWRSLDAIYPIQHDMPELYAVGASGLAASEPPERVAKARQLKAYLGVFDQMLADYLHQLAGVRQLFSLDKQLRRTYFSAYIYQVEGVLDEDQLYASKADLRRQLGLVDPVPLQQGMDDGEQLELLDPLRRSRLAESEETYLDRRNRVLDHLIGRFAERFNDYVMLSFRLAGDRLRAGQEVIDDKVAFLGDYVEVSRRRSAAFNYRPSQPAQLWDTDNVSGLERRVARLLGIEDFSRRDLACPEHFENLFGAVSAGPQFRIEIRSASDSVLFASRELFASQPLALEAARQLYPDFRSESTFQVDDSGGVGNVELALAANGVTLTAQQLFETEADAWIAARGLIDRYDELLTSGLCEDEGFHLVEHLLLRPAAVGDRLMQVCLDPDCVFCGEQDPYSFRFSVVLPYWPSRFRDMDFRRFFERTLREESPAHLHARICWVGLADMARLDEALRAWRAAMAGDDESVLSATKARLIGVLETLKTVYPAASLHDCDEGDDSPVVRLGLTSLGLF